MSCITRESKDDGYGIWRRLILIPFEVIIKEKDRGKKLPEKHQNNLNYIQKSRTYL
jgi:phage/plasmid-associated DNA primase